MFMDCLILDFGNLLYFHTKGVFIITIYFMQHESLMQNRNLYLIFCFTDDIEIIYVEGEMFIFAI